MSFEDNMDSTGLPPREDEGAGGPQTIASKVRRWLPLLLVAALVVVIATAALVASTRTPAGPGAGVTSTSDHPPGCPYAPEQGKPSSGECDHSTGSVPGGSCCP
ncbi:MAG: hypothetical protein HYX78_15965 [Armatimonadetes bacterium]|nr:hypothetical protein [Armatimonadota bacterium]